MEKLATYRNLVKELINNHAELMIRDPEPDVEVAVTFDEERDHYMLLRIGWSPRGRLFVPMLYVRLKDGKIWIENDWTEDGLATDLLEEGISSEDIVLAFHPPDMRPYTEFAVA